MNFERTESSIAEVKQIDMDCVFSKNDDENSCILYSAHPDKELQVSKMKLHNHLISIALQKKL